MTLCNFLVGSVLILMTFTVHTPAKYHKVQMLHNCVRDHWTCGDIWDGW